MPSTERQKLPMYERFRAGTIFLFTGWNANGLFFSEDQYADRDVFHTVFNIMSPMWWSMMWTVCAVASLIATIKSDWHNYMVACSLTIGVSLVWFLGQLWDHYDTGATMTPTSQSLWTYTIVSLMLVSATTAWRGRKE